MAKSNKGGAAGPIPTRHQTNIWLLGQPSQNLPDNVLPTTIDVLKTYFYHHTAAKKTVSESLKATAEDVMHIWDKARIPTAFLPNVISKMKSIVEEYNLLKKNKSRASEAQLRRQNTFTSKISLLFDIAHKNAKNMIKVEEDKVFLHDQRECRNMKMAGVDTDLTAREERSKDRKKAEEDRKLREEQRRATKSLLATSSSTSRVDDYGESDESDPLEGSSKYKIDDYEVEIPIYQKKQLQKTVPTTDDTTSATPAKRSCIQKMLTSPDVTSALDRIDLSDTKFTILAAAIAKANGENLEETSLSRSTVQRKRAAHRSAIDTTVRKEFKSTTMPSLVVYWDGKLIRDSSTKDYAKSKVDRLAVVVTGYEVEKILGIAKIPSGTGEAQAKTTGELLALWEVLDDVIGMSFDTTSSNTGSKSGACILLEKELGRNLLYFACRHHIHELIVAGIFAALFGPTSGPNIKLFQRFQEHWPKINKQNFKPLDHPELNTPNLQELKDDADIFLQGVLENKEAFPREDYKELTALCLVILGVAPEGKPYHFKIPGAYHIARWMAKVIYCFKIYLFREEFKLSQKETKSLAEFCLFASLIYVKAWIKCPISADAPANDLFLFKQIKQYVTVNESVANAALKKFQSHLWYLGPEMVLLSLFSSMLAIEDKRKLVENARKSDEDWNTRKVKLNDVNGLENKGLHELVDSSSICALRSMHIDIEFIFNSDPEVWKDCPKYRQAKKVVKSLKVVNDVAEHSVALMSSYNESITKKESEMQRLIQVVEDHRKRVPDARKCTLQSYKPR